MNDPDGEKAQLYLMLIGGSGICILLIISFCIWFCRKRSERKIKTLKERKQALEDEYGNQ